MTDPAKVFAKAYSELEKENEVLRKAGNRARNFLGNLGSDECYEVLEELSAALGVSGEKDRPA